jgi:hypothetical protein
MKCQKGIGRFSLVFSAGSMYTFPHAKTGYRHTGTLLGQGFEGC